MDHLLLPSNASDEYLDTVPLVCQEEYDGKPFLEYPLRTGRPHFMTAGTDFAAYNMHERMNSTSIPELESFLQVWLFFGLLQEILGDLYDYNDFWALDNTDSQRGKRASTSKLLALVEAWVGKRQTHEVDQPSYEHIAECLRLTFTILHGASPDINRNLRVSIASVGEVLTYAVDTAFLVVPKESRCPYMWSLAVNNARWSEQMKINGWCPSEIQKANRESYSIQYLYFIGKMKETGIVSHQSCSEWRCEASQNIMSFYQGRHRTDDCTCTDYSVDLEAIIRILAKGRLPLLRIRNHNDSESFSVAVMESHSNSQYVALSHVWADGLGNAKANALPQCQLSHIKTLVAELAKISGPTDESSELLVWIDTLCCPVVPVEAETAEAKTANEKIAEAKKTALTMMKLTYENAREVLILSPSLQNCDSRLMSKLEICVRILTSGWMRRLWTLQEGALAKRLWVQLRDQAIDLHSQHVSVERIKETEVGRRGIAQRIVIFYTQLRKKFHLNSGGLASFQQSLKNRRVSVASDEPLLIGNLLGLGAEELLLVDEHMRMEKVWSLMSAYPYGIPQYIIFRAGPKLTTRGYRWAPATLLNTIDTPGDQLLAYPKDAKVGTLSKAGFQVHLSGHLLSRIIYPRGISEIPPWNFSRQTFKTIMWFRDCDDTWYSIGQISQSATPQLCEILRDDPGDHAILLGSELEGLSTALPPYQPGLLVQCDCDDGGVKYVHSRMPVILGIASAHMSCLLRYTYRCAQVLLDSEITHRIARLHDEGFDMGHPIYQASLDTLQEKIRAVASEVDDIEVRNAAMLYSTSHTKMLEAYIRAMYIGNYVISKSLLPSSQEWCVD